MQIPLQQIVEDDRIETEVVNVEVKNNALIAPQSKILQNEDNTMFAFDQVVKNNTPVHDDPIVENISLKQKISIVKRKERLNTVTSYYIDLLS